MQLLFKRTASVWKYFCIWDKYHKQENIFTDRFVSSLVFPEHLLAQGESIPTDRQSGKNAQGPVWMNEVFLAKLTCKKEAYRG